MRWDLKRPKTFRGVAGVVWCGIGNGKLCARGSVLVGPNSVGPPLGRPRCPPRAAPDGSARPADRQRDFCSPVSPAEPMLTQGKLNPRKTLGLPLKSRGPDEPKLGKMPFLMLVPANLECEAASRYATEPG